MGCIPAGCGLNISKLNSIDGDDDDVGAAQAAISAPSNTRRSCLIVGWIMSGCTGIQPLPALELLAVELLPGEATQAVPK